MSGGRDWTTHEAARFHEMRAKRIPMKAISSELNRTVDALQSFLRYVPATRTSPAHMGPSPRLPPRPRAEPKGRVDLWSLDDVETLRQMAGEGASAFDVADEIGRSYSAVRSKASEIGVRFTGKHRGGPRSQIDRELRQYERNAKRGSAQLLDALLAMAA